MERFRQSKEQKKQNAQVSDLLNDSKLFLLQNNF